MEDYAVVGSILALALLSYLAVLAGDKWTRVHSDRVGAVFATRRECSGVVFPKA
jgi:hypothetical protein